VKQHDRRASAIHALHCMQHRPPSSFSVRVGRSTHEFAMLLMGRFTLWLRSCHDPRCVHAWCDRSLRLRPLAPTLLVNLNATVALVTLAPADAHLKAPACSPAPQRVTPRHDVLAWISPPQSVWMEPKHNKLGRKCCARRRGHVRDYCCMGQHLPVATILQQSTPTPLLAQGSSCGHDLEIMQACSTPPPILSASSQHTVWARKPIHSVSHPSRAHSLPCVTNSPVGLASSSTSELHPP
jgi:hypothetical protein